MAGNQYTEARNRAGADTELMLNPPMLITVMRRHPLALILWIGVLAFMTYLFVDAIKTNSIGYATVRIGFVYGKAFFLLGLEWDTVLVGASVSVSACQARSGYHHL